MLLQVCQADLQFFDLKLVFICLGAEVGGDEDVVIDAKESVCLRAIEVVPLFLGQPPQNQLYVLLLLERCLLCNNHGIFGAVDCDDVLSSVDQIIVEEIGVLLEEEDIALQFGEIVHHLFYLSLLVQEAQLIEWANSFQVYFSVFTQGLFDCFHLEDVLQQGMISNKVIESGCFFLILFGLQVDLSCLCSENLFPFGLKLTSVEEFPLLHSYLGGKHGGVPTNPQLDIDFSQFPLEGVFCEVGDIFWKERKKDSTDVLQLIFELFAIELEGTVHYAAVVESGNGQCCFVEQVLGGFQFSVVHAPHQIIQLSKQYSRSNKCSNLEEKGRALDFFIGFGRKWVKGFGVDVKDYLVIFVWIYMYIDKNNRREEEIVLQRKDIDDKERKSSIRILSNASIDKNLEHPVVPSAKIHFSESISFSKEGLNPVQRTRSFDHHPRPARSFKQQSLNMRKQQLRHKKVLVIYLSGSAGANQDIEIFKGFLKEKLKENQYLCDEKIMQNYESDESFLITPEQENGVRIFYEIEEYPKINPSIDVSIDDIKEIATRIQQNYKKYDAFIVLCGFDVICSIATMVSFMLENLSKLVIFTGGYFPISYMRNDTVNNINESFSIISLAQNFNDVIIVCKNKGYRANRAIKMTQGSFDSVGSPNIDALVSVNIKIKFREYLYLPVPKEDFSIWTNISCRVGIVKFHILLNKEALEYELENPAYDGFIIESYGSSNIPLNEDILEVFRTSAQKKGKIFVNIAQPVKKVNSSIMKEFLQRYGIYFGGDMTTEAAISKLSYLLSKKYSRSEIRRLIYTNMRGELTEMKSEDQFQAENPSFMELVEQSLQRYYPSNLFESFIAKVEDELAVFLSNSDSKQIQQIFKHVKHEQREEMFKTTMVRLIDGNNLLHRAVQASNEGLYKYYLNFNINCNKEDESECSPLFYAIIQKDKKAIQYLSRKGCKVICHEDELFQLFIRQLKQDNSSFFQLLYHVQFKETLKDIINCEGRNVLHLASLLKAPKSLRFIQQKFKCNLKQRDNYGKLYTDYLLVK